MNKNPRDIISSHKCTVNDNFVILGHFLPFYPHPPNNPNNGSIKKMKKAHGEIIILQDCTKKHDYKL